jgi:hypothetical protein
LGFTGAYTTQTTKTSTGTATKTLNAAEEWWAMTVALAPYVAAVAAVAGPMQNLMGGYTANYGGQGFIAQGMQTTETGT